jgi:hypothetical protein
MDYESASLTLTLSQVRVGGKPWAEGGAVLPAVSDSEKISYDRGAVREEYAPRKDGAQSLEQSFIFSSLPPERGEVRVDCLVSTNAEPPAEGTSGPKLSFGDGEREALFIADAAAVDASGRRLPLNLTYAGGKVSVVIPPEWVAEAKLPIVLDPLVGSSLTMSTTALTNAYAANAAYNSVRNEWLVVWSDNYRSNKGVVKGQRISAAGALIGTSFEISARQDEEFPLISYMASQDRYLVVWGSFAAGSIRGCVLNGDGTSFSSVFTIDSISVGSLTVVAWLANDGTNWYVITQHTAGGVSDWNLFGWFVSPSGIVSSGPSADSDPLSDTNDPWVTFSGGAYTIIWIRLDSGTQNNPRLMARTMLPSGTFLTPATQLAGPGFLGGHYVSAGPSGTSLISWYLSNSASIVGQIFDTSLNTTTSQFNIVPSGIVSYPRGLHASAYSQSNDRWFVVHDYTPNETDLAGTRVTRQGTTVQAMEQLTTTGGSLPGLALNTTTNELLMTYVNGTSVLAQRYTMDSVATPANFAGTVQSTSSIAWSWGNVTGETGYVVHDDNHVQIGSTGVDVLTFTESGLGENARLSRHVHATSTLGNSQASNTAAKYTFIRNAGTSDYTMTVISSTQIDIVVTPPPGSTSGSTGVKIERQNGNKWTLLQDFAPTYTYHDTGRSANTTYTYRITFRSGDAVASTVSPTQSVATSAPAAPTGVAGAGQSTTSIQWTWNEVIGETGYNIYDTSNVLKGSTGANVHTFVESTGLVENTSYSRYVKATNGVGSSAASATASSYTLVHDAAVGDFTFVLATATQINVTVAPPPNNPSGGSTGCQIQRSTDNVNWTTPKAFSNVYTLSDSGLTAGTTYYYRIQYRNGNAAASAFSPSQSCTASLTPVITTPSKKTRNQNTTIAGIGVVGSLVTVSFNGTPEAGQATVNSLGTWSYSVSTKAEATYTVTAQATQGGNTSGSSNSITVTIDITPPLPPANLRVRTYNGAADVIWDPSPSSDVAGYQVSRKIGTNGAWTILNTSQLILGTQYRDSGLTNGQLYVYRVTAIDDARSD